MSLLLVDLDVLSRGLVGDLRALRRDFPRLPVLALARGTDPHLLFELGRARIEHLVLLEIEGSPLELRRAMVRALRTGAGAQVVRSFGGVLEGPACQVLRGAMELTHRSWDSDRFARSFGLSRPMLSERLKRWSLPPVGHLLLWARLFHAGYWLPDPGRSGESVSRQLEYANGAVFRRVLRDFVEATPTGIADGGGLDRVLGAFALKQGLPWARRAIAAVA